MRRVTSQPASTAPSNSSSTNDGFTPLAVIGIVAGIVVLLGLVLLIGVLMRRSKIKRRQKMILQKTSSPSLPGGSMKGIVVTRAVKTEIIPVRLGVLEARGRL